MQHWLDGMFSVGKVLQCGKLNLGRAHEEGPTHHFTIDMFMYLNVAISDGVSPRYQVHGSKNHDATVKVTAWRPLHLWAVHRSTAGGHRAPQPTTSQTTDPLTSFLETVPYVHRPRRRPATRCKVTVGQLVPHLTDLPHWRNVSDDSDNTCYTAGSHYKHCHPCEGRTLVSHCQEEQPCIADLLREALLQHRYREFCPPLVDFNWETSHRKQRCGLPAPTPSRQGIAHWSVGHRRRTTVPLEVHTLHCSPQRFIQEKPLRPSRRHHIRSSFHLRWPRTFAKLSASRVQRKGWK